MAAEALECCGRHWREVRVATTQGPGHGVALVREAIEQGCVRVLALGGDGTVHEAANGILAMPSDRRPSLGVIPVGTGNDYAKLSGTFGSSVPVAVQRLAHAREQRFDAGRAMDEYFINSIGIGFDAESARRVSGYRWLRGMPAYLTAAIATYSAYEAPLVSVQADGIEFEERSLLIEVGIGAIVGGGFKLTPDARPDDGLFDVCAVQRLGALGFVFKLPLAMIGRHGKLKGVRMFRTARLTVASPSGVALSAQLDGEFRTITSPVEIVQLPAALPVLVAPSDA